MDINAEKIKTLRLSKSWTQQHLADACGLSLRTIQRVERHGAASKETALSLAAVFEISMDDIMTTSGSEQSVSGTIPNRLIALSFLLGGFSGAIIMHLLS